MGSLCSAGFCLAKSPSLPAVVVVLSDCHVEAILSGERGDGINEEHTDGSG